MCFRVLSRYKLISRCHYFGNMLSPSYGMKRAAVCFSETVASSYESTRRQNPEEHHKILCCRDTTFISTSSVIYCHSDAHNNNSNAWYTLCKTKYFFISSWIVQRSEFAQNSCGNSLFFSKDYVIPVLFFCFYSSTVLPKFLFLCNNMTRSCSSSKFAKFPTRANWNLHSYGSTVLKSLKTSVSQQNPTCLTTEGIPETYFNIAECSKRAI
jgi:hypothetical protein